jgi:hypothetical protein
MLVGMEQSSFELSQVRFEFVTEQGAEKLTLAEYHKKPELMEMIGLASVQPRGRRTVFLGTTIVSYSFDYLAQNKKAQATFDELERIRNENPLKYFVPQSESALMFLNDLDDNLKMFIACNGAGKTSASWIDVLLDIVPCDPEWPIFKYHGVKWRPYRGPFKTGGVGIVSYEWANHVQTIYPQVLQRWTPKEGLGEYAEGGKSVVNWKNNPHLFIYDTPVFFHACSQAQTVFESGARDIIMWDEQGEEAKFDAANRAVRRRSGRHVFALTPHKVEGRPDTGAGTWIHKLFSGEQTSGCNVKTYTCSVFDLPDWVYSEQAKKNAYKEWVEEPTKNNNIAKLREGRARLYGEFHVSGGLVFSDWNPEYHLIDQFDIPSTWTKYRYIDHGRLEPTACIWVAVSPEADCFIYREMYATDKLVEENAKEIIRLSGNKRELISQESDSTGRFSNRYAEVMCGEKYVRTVMDSRSMAKPSDNLRFTVGDLYKICGLRCQPADGQGTEKQAAIAAEYFKLDFDRKHYVRGEYGAPRLYVFKTCPKFVWEIQQYTNTEVTRKDRSSGRTYKGEKPRPMNDHLMSCVLFMACDNPRFIPGASDVDKARDEDSDTEYYPRSRNIRDKITGY